MSVEKASAPNWRMKLWIGVRSQLMRRVVRHILELPSSVREEEDSNNYKLLLILILAGLAVLFIIQNVAVVEIQFLF